MTKQGIERLKLDEGFRERVYLDTKGIQTVGYGYNLEANPHELSDGMIEMIHRHGISQEFAEELLLVHVIDLEKTLHNKLEFWSKLSLNRRDCLINMAYNMGIDGLLKFKKTLHLMGIGNYHEAAIEMLESLWAKQVGNRARRLANIIATGEYNEKIS